MYKLEYENTDLLKNGNFFPSIRDIYAEPFASSLTNVDVLWKGAPTKGIQNISNEDIFLKSGYDTTANGACDDLVLKPNHVIIRSYKGDGWSFSSYRVFDPDWVG